MIRKIFNNNMILAEPQGKNELCLMGIGMAF
ncbi:CAT RNA binding domain-containing protein [Niallia nealsonii]|nr:CAT RNA binding domain-containing protein [Niallia nealsonii]